MRHYQSTLTCLDRHLGTRAKYKFGTQMELRKVKISEAEPAKADSWRCCWTELTLTSMSKQESSCGDAESKKLEHFSLSIFFFMFLMLHFQ